MFHLGCSQIWFDGHLEVILAKVTFSYTVNVLFSDQLTTCSNTYRNPELRAQLDDCEEYFKDFCHYCMWLCNHVTNHVFVCCSRRASKNMLGHVNFSGCLPDLQVSMKISVEPMEWSIPFLSQKVCIHTGVVVNAKNSFQLFCTEEHFYLSLYLYWPETVPENYCCNNLWVL